MRETIPPELSLVIPCYNEEANLSALVARCREIFCDQPVEIILVDNGSTTGRRRCWPNCWRMIRRSAA